MVVLQENVYIRGRNAKQQSTISWLHCALIFVSAALLLLAHIDYPLARNIQRSLDLWGARPISWARDTIAPAGHIWERAHLAFAGDLEVVRLRRENIRLKALEDRMQLYNVRMQELQRLAKFISQDKQAPLLTARVLAGANGFFGHSLLLDVGSNNGIRHGYAVHNFTGLIGRIIDVTDDTARVLLLSDAESRVPVAVGDNMYHAILAGAGSQPPRLLFVPETAQIKDGDQVVTSGAGGVMAAGRLVGRVSVSADGFKVQLAAFNRKFRYVAIERYAGPAARLTDLLATKALERSAKHGVVKRQAAPFAGAQLNLKAAAQ